MILSVIEYQKIYINVLRELEKGQISLSDAEALRRIDTEDKNIFRWGNHTVSPQQWVGVITLPGFSLEILPKIAGNYEQAFIRKLLLFMCNRAYQVPTRKNIKAKVAFSKNGLMEMLIANYLEVAEYYIRQGFLYGYCKTERATRVVKGSICLAKQMSRTPFPPTKIVCRYSQLDLDQPVNQFIKYILQRMQTISMEYENIRCLQALLTFFQGVTDCDERSFQRLQEQEARQNKTVKELMLFGKLFLDGYGVSLSYGEHLVSSLLFDMNKIFERFLYHSYKRIFGAKICYQNNENYLLTEKGKDRKKIRLRPDLLITGKDGLRTVVDMKWKIIRSFAQEVDAYQMNAYVSAIPNVKEAILLYPLTPQTAKVAGNYEFLSEGSRKELKIRTVDLSMAMEEKKFYEHLCQIIGSSGD